MHQAIVAVEAALIVLNGEFAPNSAILIIEMRIPSRCEQHWDGNTTETRTPSSIKPSRPFYRFPVGPSDGSKN